MEKNYFLIELKECELEQTKSVLYESRFPIVQPQGKWINFSFLVISLQFQPGHYSTVLPTHQLSSHQSPLRYHTACSPLNSGRITRFLPLLRIFDILIKLYLHFTLQFTFFTCTISMNHNAASQL